MTIWLLGVVWMTACGDSTTNTTPASPSAGVPFTITDLLVGGGAQAAPGNRPVVNYTGWLYDANATENKGPQFDSGQGFTFHARRRAGHRGMGPGRKRHACRRLSAPRHSPGAGLRLDRFRTDSTERDSGFRHRARQLVLRSCPSSSELGTPRVPIDVARQAHHAREHQEQAERSHEQRIVLKREQDEQEAVDK